MPGTQWRCRVDLTLMPCVSVRRMACAVARLRFKRENTLKWSCHLMKHCVLQSPQGRIMYATYRLVQKMPGGEKLTGFTRIMHRMTDDPVISEIPTWRRVDNMQPGGSTVRCCLATHSRQRWAAWHVKHWPSAEGGCSINLVVMAL